LKLSVTALSVFTVECRRDRSTKTRIETHLPERGVQREKAVEETDPPKQGLKRGRRAKKCPFILVEETDPPKQGLKLTS